MNNIVCTLCNSNSERSTITLPYLTDSSKTYTYVKFECCNYYRQKEFLSDEALQQIYDEAYEGFGEKGIFGTIKNAFTYVKSTRFRNYLTNKDVLEVGSGTGQFLHACRKNNPTSVQGIELSQYAVDYAKSHFQIETTQGMIEDFKTEKKFDTIFMFHVIEHFKDPIQVVKKLHTLLKPNGVLIMETPNWDSWEQQVFTKEWYGWQVPFHTFVFNPNSLAKLVEIANYNVTHLIHSPVPNSWSSSLKRVSHLVKTHTFLLMLTVPVFILIAALAKLCKKSGRITIIAQKYE